MTKDQEYKLLFENWKQHISEKEEKEEEKKEDEEWPVGTPGRYYDPSPEIKPDDSTPEPDLGDLAALAALSLGPSLIKGAAGVLAARAAKKALAKKAGKDLAKKGLLAKIKQMGAKKAALAVGGFLFKRVLGPVGVLWTIYDIYNILKDDDETPKDAKEALKDPEFKEFEKELKKLQQQQQKDAAATGTTTTATTKNGKKVKVKLDTRNILIPNECLDPGNAMQASKDPRCPIYYDGTEEEQIQKAREYIALQQQKKTEKPTPGKKAKIADWKKDTEFLNKVKEWSDKNSVPMKNILAVMLHETAGSMDPAEKNDIGCVGLIQFCPGARAGQALVGKTGDELAAMTRAEQWGYVEKFLEKNNKWKNDPTSLSTLYLSIFLPAFAHLPNDAILATKTGTGVDPKVAKIRSRKTIARVWKQNPANRTGKDGPITKDGIAKNLAQRWRNKLDIEDLAYDQAPPPTTGN